MHRAAVHVNVPRNQKVFRVEDIGHQLALVVRRHEEEISVMEIVFG